MMLFKKTLIAIAVSSLSVLAGSDEISAKDVKDMSPNEVLTALKSGNARYTSQETIKHDYRADAKHGAKHGQKPMAFVLSCMDSRSIPEVVFNESAGGLFVSRVAGNVISDNMLASMEYAALVGSKVLVVMGHTSCGAVTASCEGEPFGHIDHIDHLLDLIKPAVEKQAKGLNCKDNQVVNKIAKQNVLNMVADSLTRSKYIAEKVKNKEIILVGAMHDIGSGKVEFLN